MKCKLANPTPYSQNFKPYTVQPKLETLNPKRRQWRYQKRNGKPCTRNPVPYAKVIKVSKKRKTRFCLSCAVSVFLFVEIYRKSGL